MTEKIRWKALYFAMALKPGHAKTMRVAKSLSDAELVWAGGVVVAEIARREAIKNGGGDRVNEVELGQLNRCPSVAANDLGHGSDHVRR